MNDKNIIRGPKPFYDIPDISTPEMLIKMIAKLDPNAICVIDANTDTKLTIKELVDKSKAIAMALIERGVVKNDLLLTFSENTIELVIFMFAAIFLGVTLYPISPSANIYELDQLLDTLGQLVIFTSKSKSEITAKIVSNNNKRNVKFMGILDGNYANYVTFEQLLKEGQNKNLERIPYFSVKSDDIMLLMQSSGTSGVPKSVMTSHKAFVANLFGVIHSDIDLEQLGGPPVFCHMTPISCQSGILVLIDHIVTGIVVVIYRTYDEKLMIESIGKYKINILSFVPSFVHKLICGDVVDKYDLSSLRLMFTTGAAVPGNICGAIVAKYRVMLQEVYGMSEYGAVTLCPDPNYTGFVSGNLGPPAHNTEVKIIDVNTGESLGPNIDGEICVRGSKLFTGYLNNELATKEAIDSEGWYHSGDIGHYDQKNRIFITDRLKELIKFGTKQVSPTELEQFLLTHECVAEVAVVGVKHEIQTQWPRAYVKLAQNKSVTEQELQKYVSDSLSDAKQLRAGVVFVDSIHRTTVGKVDRRYYKQLVANELIKNL